MNSCILVILNYNDGKRSKELALKTSAFPNISNVIIVDNNSSDDSLDYLEPIENDKIEILKSKENKGFSAGNNIGLKYAIEKYNPEFIVRANPDVSFSSELLDRCMDVLDKDPTIGVVSSRILKPNTPPLYSTKEQLDPPPFWNYMTYAESMKETFSTYKIINYLVHNRFKITYTEPVMHVEVIAGNFMFFRSKALKEADFFDDKVFMYTEEAIIGKRLNRAGYTSALITDAYYIHNHISWPSSNKRVIAMKRLLESRYYYLRTYCGMTKGKERLLRIMNKLIILEEYIIAFAENITSHMKRKKESK